MSTTPKVDLPPNENDVGKDVSFLPIRTVAHSQAFRYLGNDIWLCLLHFAGASCCSLLLCGKYHHHNITTMGKKGKKVQASKPTLELIL